MLTAKQEAFCLAYLTEPDASKAYRKVYSASNMADKTIWARASELLADSKVAVRIAELRKQSADVAVLAEADILREVARLALSDPGALFDETGALLPLKEMPAHVRASIASIEIEDWRNVGAETQTRIKKIKLWDKNSALEKAMKHLGSFERDNKQRAGMFDGMPRARVQEIHDKLRSLARPVDSQPATSGARRFTH